MSEPLAPEQAIRFLRRKDYVLVRALGQGACGQTVLLRDDVISSHFVCKKYSPYFDGHREQLFSNFLREIQLLHEVYHPNVVRVFNYYVYPERLTGYILMEYVEGPDIEDFLAANPETVNDVFRQTIDGFAYLEASNVLHRDIRPPNILVRADGVVKIIDLGFGKHIKYSDDFDKSISLNWWCEPPADFTAQTYDFATEVYFVGKLFERILQEHGLEQFKHSSVLARMCQKEPKDRVSTFSEIRTKIATDQSDEVDFTELETQAYREFADEVARHITKIESGAKYHSDLGRIRTRLEEVHRNCMLEEMLPDCAPILQTFLTGTWYYRKVGFETKALRNFVRFLRSTNSEKQRIAIANLHTRLDALPRYTAPLDQDIPF